VAVKPCGKGLLLETLHYEDEIKKAEPFFSDIGAKQTEDDLLEVATALIEKKSAKFDPKAFKDHYHAALRELIARKLKSKGKKIETDVEPEGKRPEKSNVIDLMAALKKSLDGGKAAEAKEPAAKRKAPARKPAAKKAPARRKAS
jgi:DNA end-binding protein Ku